MTTPREKIEERIRGGRKVTPAVKKKANGAARDPLADLFATLYTSDNLTRMEFSKVKYLTQERIPRGLVLLSARPKMKKSFFALQVEIAAAKGGDFLGKPTFKGRSLGLFLEDNKRRMQIRLKFLGVDAMPTDQQRLMHFVHAWPKGEKGVAALREWMSQHPDTVLIVVDVLQKFRGEQDQRKSAYALDYAALESLQTLAREYPDLTILVIHHNRKGGSETPSEKVSGTFWLVGAADAYIILDNPPIAEANTYSAHIDCRDWDSFVHDFIFRFDDAGWQYVRPIGDEDQLTPTQRDWLNFVRTHGRITPSKAGEERSVSQSAASQMLAQLEKRGFLASEHGVYRALG